MVVPPAPGLPDPLPHLPPPPCRVLLAGSDPGPLADSLTASLTAAGYEVERLPEPLGSSSSDELLEASGGGATGEAVPAPVREAAPEAVREAVVLELAPGETLDPEAVAALRARLPEEGRLVVVVRFRTLDQPARDVLSRLVRHLHEGRFAVLLEEAHGGPGEGQEAADATGGGAFLVVARPSAYRIRPYREGDETAILDLFQRAFHHRRSLPRWRWAYRDAPYGAHHVSVAEDREGHLLAHYAGYPVRFWTDLPELSGGAPWSLHALHIGDTMTAPEARRVGRRRTNLLTRTVSHFYATFCRGRVAFNYGTNTGKIQRFSRRTAGALRVEDAPFRVRSLESPIAAPGPLGTLLAGWRVEPVAVPEARGGGAGGDGGEGGAAKGSAEGQSGGEQPEILDERWDELWRRCRGAYRFLVQRDVPYLRWRYACPDVGYHLWAVFRRRRLVGWSAFRQEGDRLFWGDALFDPRFPEAPAVLLSRVVAAPQHQGVQRIEGWLTDRPAWWGRIVDDLGFVRQPEPEDLGLVYVPFLVDPSEAMARHLYYTKADFDLF